MRREDANSFGIVPNLLSRWHQLQLKLIWELVQVLQLVNWRQAGEGGERSTEVSSSLLNGHNSWSGAPRTACTPFILLGSGVISTAVELVILVLVSSTRWYS